MVITWLVKWRKKLNIQLFVTTHRLEVIDEFLAAINSNTNLFLYRLEQKKLKLMWFALEEIDYNV